MTCLVSGGPDSTCLWHALGALGYRVSAVHVNHGLRGAESEADAVFCRDTFGAEVIEAAPGRTEAELRDLRYELTAGRGLRATGHTASDQVETVLYRLAASGSTRGIKSRREDGVVRPLLDRLAPGDAGVLRRERPCDPGRLVQPRHPPRPDPHRDRPAAATPPSGRRGEHPAARRRASASPARNGGDAARAALLARRHEVPRSRERDPGGARIRSCLARRRPRAVGPLDDRGDRARSGGSGSPLRRPARGRRKKLQDVFVDAKVPRAERDGWPVVANDEEEVVAVPGIVEDARVRVART